MNKPRLLLTFLAASFLIAGVLEPLRLQPGEFVSAAGLVHMFVIAVLLNAWCRADAAQRGTVPPAGAALLCAFLAPVGLSYYFFHSRPWRNALVGIAAAVAFFVLATALFYAGFYAKAYVVA